jgi:hypothetical protein
MLDDRWVTLTDRGFFTFVCAKQDVILKEVVARKTIFKHFKYYIRFLIV